MLELLKEMDLNFENLPVFRKPGSQIEQLFNIFQTFGTPNNQTWRGAHLYPHFKNNFPQFRGIISVTDLSVDNFSNEVFSSTLERILLTILKKTLVYRPKSRCTANMLIGLFNSCAA